jgi:hypothetical protein
MTERSLSMSLVIFSCSPRAKNASNTAIILKAFISGYETKEDKAALYYLYERDKWEEYRKIFYESKEMIFAMPLFVECIPGILMEFIETLVPKVYEEAAGERSSMAFILQGGFAEANQLRTGEHYLERLPKYLNCEYGGTLIKGNMFGLTLVPDASQKNMVKPFIDMGKEYGRVHRFNKEEVTAFAAPEHFSKFQIFYMDIIMRYVSRIVFSKISKKLGAKEKLDACPYLNEL